MGNGGRREGAGRKKGVKNKATIARMAEAELRAEVIAAVRAGNQELASRLAGKKRGVEILADFANLFAGMAARHQPWPKDAGKNPDENERRFDKYSRLAVFAAARLAPFQDPRLGMLAIAGSFDPVSGLAAPPPSVTPTSFGLPALAGTQEVLPSIEEFADLSPEAAVSAYERMLRAATAKPVG